MFAVVDCPTAIAVRCLKPVYGKMDMKVAVMVSHPRTGMALLLILSSVLLLPAAANGVTYRVGPDEQLSKVSEIADKLEAGDVVEITGDITDAFTLTAHGTKDKPITIRGNATFFL